MERNVGEDFDDYKARRATSNLVRKNINRSARGGGKQANPRASRAKRSFGIKGIRYTNMTAFGADLAASRASRRATGYLLVGHQQYLAKIAARKERRLAEAAERA